MNEYRASVASTGEPSHLGPFTFQRRIFTDSDGHQVAAWMCATSRHGRTNRKARTRAHALSYWLTGRMSPGRLIPRRWHG